MEDSNEKEQALEPYFVLLLDKADHHETSQSVMARDYKDAEGIAKTQMEEDCGEGFLPLLTFSANDIAAILRDMESARAGKV